MKRLKCRTLPPSANGAIVIAKQRGGRPHCSSPATDRAVSQATSPVIPVATVARVSRAFHENVCRGGHVITHGGARCRRHRVDRVDDVRCRLTSMFLMARSTPANMMDIRMLPSSDVQGAAASRCPSVGTWSGGTSGRPRCGPPGWRPPIAPSPRRPCAIWRRRRRDRAARTVHERPAIPAPRGR